MLAIAPGWELDVDRGPDWLLVKVKAPAKQVADLPPLADAIWEMMGRHFTYRVVIELNDIRLLNSYLVGQLIQLYKRIRDHDGVMRLCGLSARNREVLHTCQLDDRFLPYHDRQEAIMAGYSPNKPR